MTTRSSILLSVVMAIGAFQAATASPPEIISYQGILTDDQGVVVDDGQYGLLFEIFDAATAGNMIWDQPITVYVTDGLYNVLLSEAGLATAFENAETYMQVTIQTGPNITTPIVLAPRQRISSVPYALSVPTPDPDPEPQASPPVIFDHDSDSTGRFFSETSTWSDPSLGNLSVSVNVPADGTYELCVSATVSFSHRSDDTDSAFRIVNDQGTVLAGPVGFRATKDDRAWSVQLHGCEGSAAAGTTYVYIVEAVTDSQSGLDLNPDDNVVSVEEATMSTLTAWGMRVGD